MDYSPLESDITLEILGKDLMMNFGDVLLDKPDVCKDKLQ